MEDIDSGLPQTEGLRNGTVAYDPAKDVPGALAIQDLSSWLIGPIAIGNAFQIWLAGVTFTLSISVWQRRGHRLSKENKIFLIVANILNAAVTVIAIASTFRYETHQNRDYASLYSYSTIDVIGPAFQGAVAASVQSFFAWRLHKFLQRKAWVLLVLCPLIVASFGGSLLNSAASAMYAEGADLGNVLLIYAAEIWLWSSAATDTMISLILSVSLWKKKQGFAKRTENAINRIIRFSMGTAAVTSVTAVLGAVVYLVFFEDIRIDVAYIFINPLPSIYLLTMCYALSGWGKETSSGSSRSETTEPGGVRSAALRSQRVSYGQRPVPAGEEYLQEDAHIHWSPSAHRIADLHHTTSVSYIDLPPPGKSRQHSSGGDSEEKKTDDPEQA